MDALYYVIIFIFVIVCLSLVGIILMQSSQTGGLGSAIAGNALNTAFGGQGADKILVRITAALAVLFMFFAILLNVLNTPGSNNIPVSDSDSILDRNKLESIDGSFKLPIGNESKPIKQDSL